MAELEIGLEEVGLQPVDRIRIQLVLAQGLGGGSGECQVGVWFHIHARYCCNANSCIPPSHIAVAWVCRNACGVFSGDRIPDRSNRRANPRASAW